MKTRLILTAALFIGMAVAVSAQTTDTKTLPASRGQAQGYAWVDADNDGVCDNFESGRRMGQGQGKGQGQALHNGRGKGMIRGQVLAHGRGAGRGQGPNFVDENKNGICDHRETPAKK